MHKKKQIMINQKSHMEKNTISLQQGGKTWTARKGITIVHNGSYWRAHFLSFYGVVTINELSYVNI